MQFQKGCLVAISHKYAADEWGALCASACTLSDIAHKLLFNYGGKWTVKVAIANEPEEEKAESCKEEDRWGGNKNLMEAEK